MQYVSIFRHPTEVTIDDRVTKKGKICLFRQEREKIQWGPLNWYIPSRDAAWRWKGTAHYGFVKSWIQLFCGQNALIVPLWCASEQRISNKTRMTVTFTSYKVNVNLHSIRDLFKMTFKKRDQNKWLWQKLNRKNTKMIKTVSSLWQKGDRKYRYSKLMPTDHVCRQNKFQLGCLPWNSQSTLWIPQSCNGASKNDSSKNIFLLETCWTDVFHEIFPIRNPNKMRPSSQCMGQIRHMSSLHSCLALGVHIFCTQS